jgi:murein DD-endopeptidase MepM/ murein hydrolase activator NlpD
MTATAPYVNPFLGDPTVTAGRIDQGVDFSLSPGETIKAIGDAIIRGILPNWYKGQPLLWYQLTSGPQAGHYVYVAEQISPTVTPGQRVKAGQPIATYASSGTGLEMGFANASGTTAASTTGGYKEGQLTAAGEGFSIFLESLGAPGGKKEGRPTTGFFVDQTGKALKEGEQSAKIAAEGGSDAVAGGISNPLDPSRLAAGIVNDVIGWIKPSALKFLLYTVFIFGGVALAGYGLATMLKPTPPDLLAGARKLGKAAALGGEVAAV